MFPETVDTFTRFSDARRSPFQLAEKFTFSGESDEANIRVVELSEIPHSNGRDSNSVAVSGLPGAKEVFSIPSKLGEFSVDYKRGIVTFFDDCTDLSGVTVIVSYRGLGTLIRAAVFQKIVDSLVRTQEEVIRLRGIVDSLTKQ